MALRTKAREFAMQMLFQWEMSPQETRKLEIKFWRAAKAAENTEKFANELFEGATRRVKDLDATIEKHCDNWRFERFSRLQPGARRSRVRIQPQRRFQ